MNKIFFSFLFYIFVVGLVKGEPIKLATTTSTENSGLLKIIIPYFEKRTGNVVHVLAVGTGQALRMGQDGNVDVVLVHAPKEEMRFVDAGYGEIANDNVAKLEDVNNREFCVLMVLAISVLALGLWPAPLVDMMSVSIESLLSQISSSKIPGAF